MGKVNILGTEYEVIKDNTGTNPKLKDANGICELYSKKIVLEDKFDDDPMNVDNFQDFKDKIFRHEIVHAYIAESGIDECCSWGRDEMLVDWIARQIPKMCKTMKQAGCLKDGD